MYPLGTIFGTQNELKTTSGCPGASWSLPEHSRSLLEPPGAGASWSLSEPPGSLLEPPGVSQEPPRSLLASRSLPGASWSLPEPPRASPEPLGASWSLPGASWSLPGARLSLSQSNAMIDAMRLDPVVLDSSQLGRPLLRSSFLPEVPPMMTSCTHTRAWPIS